MHKSSATPCLHLLSTSLTFGEASNKQEIWAGNYLSLPETITKYALLHVNGKCVDTLCTINTTMVTRVLSNVTEVCADDCGLNNKRLTASNAAVHFYLQHDHT
jgi:hypothetical protein